jgi:ABC-type transport system substrate-binding protein
MSFEVVGGVTAQGADLHPVIHQGKDVPGIKANPELVYVEAPWVGNQYRLHMSSIKGKFAGNLKLRQAAWTAIDRESIAKTLGQGVGAPLKYHALKGALGYDDSVPFYSYDVNKAKQLMKDAGLETGIDIAYTVMSRQLDQQQAQMIQQMFQAVGIRATLDVVERNVAQVKMVQSGEYDFGSSRNPAMPDIGMALVSQMSSWGAGNYTHINDAKMDQCIKDGDQNFDIKQRHEIYKKCLTLDYEMAYTGYSWVQIWNYVHNKKVQGFKPSWGQNWWIKEIWLDK